MIVDIHGHTVAPPEIYEHQAKLIGRRSARKPPAIPDDVIASYLSGHISLLDEAGTDIQFISPRPYLMLHSQFNAKVVRSWTEFVNDTIQRQCSMGNGRFRGVAGLPQYRDTELGPVVDELERCVTELGFVGCLLNPDPLEGDDPGSPGLGDPYWYPLYQKLVELDVPALVHSASCNRERESYSTHFINEETIAVVSLLNSSVFDDFPDLKIVIAHGGGAVPYQIGRFRAPGLRRRDAVDFEERIKLLNFDTCLYSKEGLELLLKVVGADNCLFGTERPGTGSPVDPRSGQALDFLAPILHSIEGINDEDRYKIFEGNARRLYSRAFSNTSKE